MAAVKFHTLTIAAIRQETADAVVIGFDLPCALRPAFAFRPGQYLTLKARIKGRDVRRSYSICSAPGDALISVGIKKIEGGAFSAFAQTLRAGQSLDVMPPQGRFTQKNAVSDGDTGDTGHTGPAFLLLAAGSGITPMVSIARSVLAGQPGARINLCYANRSSAGIMFKDTFDDLKDRYFTRFQLTHVLDEEYQDIDLFNGRIDGEKLATLATANIIDPLAYDTVFICGPEPMIKAAAKALEELGVAPGKIRFELFTSANDSPGRGNPIAGEAQTPAAGVSVTENRSHITLMLDGVTRSFFMARDAAFVRTAEDAGLDVPYSCNNGMCATCRCKLVSGEAGMRQNFSLEPWETKAGFILACQLEPKSEKIVLDFDAL